MSKEWFCFIGEKMTGPMESVELLRMAQAGQLIASNLVRKGKEGEWVAASMVKGLTFGVQEFEAPIKPNIGVPAAERIPPPPPSQIVVTTGDLKQKYDIIGPVYFQVSNKAVLFSKSTLSVLMKKYKAELESLRSQGLIDGLKADWGFLIGEWSVGQTEFDQAFFVAVQELKARAAMLGADAIIGMRQDIDLDSTGWQFFYLQMYGTAVKLC